MGPVLVGAACGTSGRHDGDVGSPGRPEGAICYGDPDVSDGGYWCDPGLVCTSKAAVKDAYDRCCPPEGKCAHDEMCMRAWAQDAGCE